MNPILLIIAGIYLFIRNKKSLDKPLPENGNNSSVGGGYFPEQQNEERIEDEGFEETTEPPKPDVKFTRTRKLDEDIRKF